MWLGTLLGFRFPTWHPPTARTSLPGCLWEQMVLCISIWFLERSQEKIRLILTCGIYLTIFIFFVEQDHFTTLPVMGFSAWRGSFAYGPNPLKVISEVHGRNWSYIWWAWVLAYGSSNPQICCLTLAMNTTFRGFFQFFYDGSWICNY